MPAQIPAPSRSRSDRSGSRARQRPAPQRADGRPPAKLAQPLSVPREGPEVREPPVRNQHRLRPLCVGIPRHRNAEVLLGAGNQAGLQLAQPVQEAVVRRHQPQAEVGRHLVVPAAAGVQLSGRVADQFPQPPFDRGVDIFVRRGKGEGSGGEFLADLLQAAFDLPGFSGGEDADLPSACVQAIEPRTSCGASRGRRPATRSTPPLPSSISPSILPVQSCFIAVSSYNNGSPNPVAPAPASPAGCPCRPARSAPAP